MKKLPFDLEKSESGLEIDCPQRKPGQNYLLEFQLRKQSNYCSCR